MQKNSTNILFSVCTFNRFNYAKKSINSLIDILYHGDVLFITDDCSTEEEMDYFLIEKNILHDYNIFASSRPFNLGVDLSNAERFFKSDYSNISNEFEFMYLTDSDIEYSSKFYEHLNVSVDFMKSNKEVFATTLFNSINNGTHTEIGYPIIHNFSEKQYSFIEKKSFGGCSILIRIEDFKKAIENFLSPNYKGKQGWDWSICEYSKKINKKLFSTSNSYIEHIGIHGVNSHPNNYDYAKNFIK